jgi:hypothetical protein
MGPTPVNAKTVSSLIHCPDESKNSQLQNEIDLQHYQEVMPDEIQLHSL